MLKMQRNSILSISPSFNSYSNTRLVDIAARVCEEVSIEEEEEEVEENLLFSEEKPTFSEENPPPEQSSEDPPLEEVAEEEEDSESDDDFEFALVTRDPNASPISADEIFFNGQIRPIFPIFDQKLVFSEANDEDKEENASSLRLPLRKLLTEDRNPAASSSSSESDEIEGIPAGTYCVWTPKQVSASPDVCKKSNSTGSSKRWRFRDLLHRSNSDGKDTYVFLTPAPKKKEEKVENKKEKISGERRTVKPKPKGISPHEILYVRNRAMKEEDRRRSYLPYKPDLVGFFANVNGLGRNHHPF